MKSEFEDFGLDLVIEMEWHVSIATGINISEFSSLSLLCLGDPALRLRKGDGIDSRCFQLLVRNSKKLFPLHFGPKSFILLASQFVKWLLRYLIP